MRMIRILDIKNPHRRSGAKTTSVLFAIRAILMRRLTPPFILLLCAPLLAAGAETNLIENGSFENDEHGGIAMWSLGARENNAGSVRFFSTEIDRHSGLRSIVIANLRPNDSWAAQWVKVKPGTFYRFSCWIEARDVVSGTVGANISIQGSTRAAGDFRDTGGRWHRAELVGKTGPAQTSLCIMVRLGFFDSLATGTALFDDAVFEEIAGAPDGTVEIIDFSAGEAPGIPAVRSEADFSEGPPGHVSNRLFFGVIVLLAIAVAIVGFMIWRDRPRRADRHVVEHRKSPRVRFSARVSLVKHKTRATSRIFSLKGSNISETGIYLYGSDPYELSLLDEVKVKVFRDDELVDLGKAVVVGIRSRHDRSGKLARVGFGMKFSGGSAAVVEARRKLINQPAAER